MKIALLHAAFFTPMSNGTWGLPVLFEGEPGAAKSAVIEGFAKRCGVPCEILSPSERGEGAFGVVPVPAKSPGGGVVMTYPRPDWTAKMDVSDENPRGIGLVFADEVTSAPPILQAPVMGLVHGKRIGSFTLGRHVRVIGACNPPEVAANGYDLAPPLANRFGWLKWENPTVEQHVQFMLGAANGVDEQPINAVTEEDRVMGAWGEAYAKAVGLETSFLQAQADFKNKCPKPGSPKASRAWPSDRTWDFATRALASADVHNLAETDRDELVTGFIGAEAFEAFATYIENADLPNVGDVLDGKVKFKPHPSRLDKTAAVINTATALVTPSSAAKRKERTEALWKLLAEVGGGSLDLVVPCAQSLIGAGLHGFQVAIPLLAKVQPIIAAANARR